MAPAQPRRRSSSLSPHRSRCAGRAKEGLPARFDTKRRLKQHRARWFDGARAWPNPCVEDARKVQAKRESGTILERLGERWACSSSPGRSGQRNIASQANGGPPGRGQAGWWSTRDASQPVGGGVPHANGRQSRGGAREKVGGEVRSGAIGGEGGSGAERFVKGWRRRRQGWWRRGAAVTAVREWSGAERFVKGWRRRRGGGEGAVGVRGRPRGWGRREGAVTEGVVRGDGGVNGWWGLGRGRIGW